MLNVRTPSASAVQCSPGNKERKLWRQIGAIQHSGLYNLKGKADPFFPSLLEGGYEKMSPKASHIKCNMTQEFPVGINL